MNFYEILSVSIFICLMLAIILANYALQLTVWRWCYRCRVWHNDVGERTAITPCTGRLAGACLCERCRKECEE